MSTRRFSFPADRPRGRVYTRPVTPDRDQAISGTLSAIRGWRFIGFARGEVEIPDNASVLLATGLPAAGDLAFLNSLTTTALDVLSIFATEIKMGDLAPVASLQGLRSLAVTAGSIAAEALSGLQLPHSLRVLSLSSAAASHLARPAASPPDLNTARMRNVSFDASHRDVLDRITELTVVYDHGLRGAIPRSQELAWIGGLTRLRQLEAALPGREAAAIDWAGLQGLERLSLRDGTIDPAAVEALARLPGLKALDVGDSSVEAGTLALLGRLTQLEDLALGEGAIDEAELAAIAALPNLRALSVRNAQIDAGLATLNTARRLQFLDLSGTTFNDSPAGVSDLDKLITLSLERTPATGAVLRSFTRNAKLQTLRLSACSAITDEAVEALAGQDQLRELDLGGTAMTGEAVRRLPPMPALEVLSLSELEVGPEIGAVVGAPLQELDLEASRVHAGTLHALSGCESLQIINLAEADIDDAELEHLGRFPRLANVTLPGNGQSLAWIERASSLDTLSLANGRIDDATLMETSRSASLRVLRLDSGRVSIAGEGPIPQNLQDVQLPRANVEAAPAAFSRLRRAEALERLDLSLAKVSAADLAPLSGHPSLRWLGLHDLETTPPLLQMLATLAALDSLSGWLVARDEQVRLQLLEQLPWCWSLYPGAD